MAETEHSREKLAEMRVRVWGGVGGGCAGPCGLGEGLELWGRWEPQKVLSKGRMCLASVAHRRPLAAVEGTDWGG